MDAGSLSALNRIQVKLKITRSELFKAVLLEAGAGLVEHPNSALAKRFFKAASLVGALDANP